MNIPHSKPTLTSVDTDAVSRQLLTGQVARGERVVEFQKAAAEYLGMAGGTATASGSAALLLILTAMGIGEGDEVIIPTYVCRSVLDAVLAVRARPVLCDVGDDWCMTPHDVRSVLTPRTKAVVVVHLFGILADARGIAGLGVPVIEDICQRFGAEPGAAVAGGFGRFSFASFHATKLLATGEGGMALGRTSGDAELLSETACGRREGTAAMGSFAPLGDMSAALGLAQLARYPTFLERRRLLAERYRSRLEGLALEPSPDIRQRSIYFRYPVRIKNLEFETLRERCAKQGVQIRRGVDALLHRVYPSAATGRRLSNAERLFGETVSLPIYPLLTDGLQDLVCKTLREVL